MDSVPGLAVHPPHLRRCYLIKVGLGHFEGSFVSSIRLWIADVDIKETLHAHVFDGNHLQQVNDQLLLGWA